MRFNLYEKCVFRLFVLYWIFLVFRSDHGFVLGIKWLALKEEDVVGAAEDPGDELVSDEGASCGRARALGVHPCAALVHVARAATLAKGSCKRANSNGRWNCSSVDLAPDFTPELILGTKEQSFVYALSSAALTYTMARACASGALFSCTCAQPPRQRPNGNFKWGGCSDNLKWASRFARQFAESNKKPRNRPKTTLSPQEEEKRESLLQTTTSMEALLNNRSETVSFYKRKYPTMHEMATLVKRDIDGSYRKKSGQEHKRGKVVNKAVLEKKIMKLQPYIDVANLHNSKTGRKFMERWLAVECKCHGVSGSCSVRTCWRALKPLDAAATRLRNAMGRAARLPRTPPPIHPPPIFSAHKSVLLLYVTQSPDFCSYNPTTGSLGTRGRSCNGTIRSGEGSCRNMCCGRGYKTSITETIERCNCKYIWCCRVECDKCKNTTEVHNCN